MLAICEKYLGLDRNAAGIQKSWTDGVDVLPLLEDMLSGGVYGDATVSRKQSSNMTLDAVAAEKQGKGTPGGILGSLFPAAEKLEGRYPYLKKQPWLLGAAWFTRLTRYGAEVLRREDSDAAEALRIGRERTELLRKLDILD